MTGKKKRRAGIKKWSAVMLGLAVCGSAFSGTVQAAEAEGAERDYGVYGSFDAAQTTPEKEIGESIGKTGTSIGDQFSTLGEGNTLSGKVSGRAGGSMPGDVSSLPDTGYASPGAGNTAGSTGNVPAAQTGSFRFAEVEDASTGMKVARCYVPSDYTVSGETFWCGKWQSIGAPAQVYITAASPDQNTVMGYYSIVCYEEIVDYSQEGITLKSHQDGVFDATSLVPMLRFMTADSYCDYLAQIILPGQELVLQGQAEITAEQQSIMDTMANNLYQQSLQLSGGTGAAVEGAYFGMAERTYSVTLDGYPFLLTVSTATEGVQISYTMEMAYQMGTCHSTFVGWDSPYTFFMLTPESEYQAHTPMYEQFIMNTSLSDQFINAFNTAKNQITQQMLQTSSASMDAVSDYCRSSISSAAGSETSYSDERFTDYIYDQNDYTLSNGDHVKVSTSYDYVYADDSGNVYVSNSADQPAGTTRLYPN